MPEKKPWGSKQMKALLTRIQMPNPNAAMSEVMALDFASREDNANEALTIAEDLADMHPHDNKEGLIKLILNTYDKIDRAFQPEAYAQPDFEEDSESGSEDDSQPQRNTGGDIKAEMARTIDRMAGMMASGNAEKAKQIGLSFATDLFESGRVNKAPAKIVRPMLESAMSKARKQGKTMEEMFEDDRRAAREQAEIDVEMDKAIWDHPDFQSIALAFTQAAAKKDAKLRDRVIAAAVNKAQQISDQKGLGLRVTEKLVLQNFLPMDQWPDDGSDASSSSDSSSSGGDGDNDMMDDLMRMQAEQGDIPLEEDDAARLALKDVAKVKWDTISEIYGFDKDDAPELEKLATTVVKKGMDDAGAQKSAKDLLSRAQKQKKKPKVKNGKLLVFGLFDAMFRTKNKKKVTKPVKASDLPE